MWMVCDVWVDDMIKLALGLISLNSILTMSSIYKGPGVGRRKIKHFSFSEADRIGKGYSSVVYKATN